MSMNPRLLRPTANDSPASIPGLALWLDASAAGALYTTDAGPVSPVSSPLDIAGCALWLDASDASTISDTAGAVDQWDDKSGNGFNLSQATASNKPTTGTRSLNGLNVIDFDGTNDVLSLGGYTFSDIIDSKAMSAFFVMASDSPNAVRRAFSLQRTGKNSNDTGVFIGRHTTSSGSMDFATGAGDSATNDQVDKNLINVFADTSSSAGLYGFTISAAANAKSMFKSGAAQATTVRYGTLAASSFLSEGSGDHTVDIGASRNSGNTIGEYWDGYIAEIIVYDSALSTADRARVESYLASKWGIANVHAPAVSASDPVGYWRDRSGNNRHATQSTAASRPVVGSQNGKRALSANGTSQWMSMPNALGVARNVPGLTIMAALNPNTATGARSVAFWSVGTSGAARSLLQFENAAARAGGRRNDADSFDSATSGVITANQPMAAIASLDYANATATAFVNGVAFAEDASFLTAGNTSNTDSQAASIMSSAGSLFYSGIFAELAAWPRVLTLAERRKAERYLARRWGITLAPQVSNSEAQDWISRVYANGGTVTQSTANAVSAMCDSLESAGIRDRFYRLNLFCGSNLNAALVPLYRGPTFGGTTYGNTTDTNNGPFLSGDFNESVGLNANGSSGNSSKYLDTGLAPDDTPTGSTVGHASVWKGAGSSGVSTLSFIGSRTALAFWYTRQNATTDNLTGNWGVGAFVGSTSDTAAGLVLHTRDASGYVLYKNTSSIGTAGAASPGGNANDFVVFNHRGTDGSVSSAAGWPFVISSYSIGDSLSSTEVTSYYNALTAFNTAMGR